MFLGENHFQQQIEELKNKDDIQYWSKTRYKSITIEQILPQPEYWENMKTQINEINKVNTNLFNVNRNFIFWKILKIIKVF